MAHAYVSAVIGAPIERVWATARDFNGHAAWHPFITESHIEDGLAPDAVGCVRNFVLGNGGHLRERLLALNDVDHSFSYCILESPMPIADYHATFRLTSITEGGGTFVEWQARFDVAPEDEARIKEQVGRATFAEGILALEAYIAVR